VAPRDAAWRPARLHRGRYLRWALHPARHHDHLECVVRGLHLLFSPVFVILMCCGAGLYYTMSGNTRTRTSSSQSGGWTKKGNSLARTLTEQHSATGKGARESCTFTLGYHVSDTQTGNVLASTLQRQRSGSSLHPCWLSSRFPGRRTNTTTRLKYRWAAPPGL
jgi:hypothetical protein